jgi:sporulation-control protein spo0M
LEYEWRVCHCHRQATVQYHVEAEVDAKGFFSWDIKHSQPLVINQALLGSIVPARASRTSSAMVCCCINKGQVTMDATFDKNAYTPGEQAQIVCQVNNQSTVDVQSINVKLMRKTVLRASGQSQQDVDVVWQQSYPGVPKGSTLLGSETRHIPLMIPASVQPGTLSQVVRCEYWVDVECDISWAR